MKKSAFAFIAFLALAGVTFGSMSLSLDLIDSPTADLNRYMLRATGTGITVLSQFQINIPVYQVWNEGEFPEFLKTQTEWINNGTMTANTKDSYVVFGTERIQGNVGVVPDIVTKETNAGAIDGTEGALSGWGDLDNYTTTGGVGGDKTTWDAYLRTWNTNPPSLTTPETVDLMQLVIAKNQVFSTNPAAPDISVNLGYVTADFDPATGDPDPIIVTLTVPPQQQIEYMDGDTDKDDDVDLVDFDNFASGWNGPDGVTKINTTPEAAWEWGDFDEDGDVDLVDFDALATNWLVGTAASASAVPEPGTIAMLILGALCLLGYRLRK